MYVTMSATEYGQAPARNDFSPYALFSIAWMCLGYIFAINLFVGVVVDNFARMQKEESGSAIMTLEQQQWVETVKAMAKRLPQRAWRVPTSFVRRPLYNIVDSRTFDGFITGVIVANILVRSHGHSHDARSRPIALRAFRAPLTPRHRARGLPLGDLSAAGDEPRLLGHREGPVQPRELQRPHARVQPDLLHRGHAQDCRLRPGRLLCRRMVPRRPPRTRTPPTCTARGGLPAGILSRSRRAHRTRARRCRFDFFLVCTAALDQFASELLALVFPMPPMLLRALRILRILRILRLLKGAKGLRDLILTMVR